MHASLAPFASAFHNVIRQFDLTTLTQLTETELVELLAEYFAAALRRGENEQQFLERMKDLFTVGELVYASKGFYPDFPNDDADTFWADVAKALLNETRDQLNAQGYLTGGA